MGYKIKMEVFMENRNHSPYNINSINSKLSHSPLLHPVTSGAVHVEANANLDL